MNKMKHMPAMRHWVFSLLVLSACQEPDAMVPEPAGAQTPTPAPTTAPVPDESTTTVVPATSALRAAAIQDLLRQPDSTGVARPPALARADSTWLGRDEAEVRSSLGSPRAELRLNAANPTYSKAVLIYPVAPDDPTGLYLFLRSGRVDSVRRDEFNGLEGSSALRWFSSP